MENKPTMPKKLSLSSGTPSLKKFYRRRFSAEISPADTAAFIQGCARGGQSEATNVLLQPLSYRSAAHPPMTGAVAG
jgi:hypothetical protein